MGCNDYLMHHGIKGQKWGVRRYQNEDGSLTEAGRRRFAKDLKKRLAASDKRYGKAYTDYHKTAREYSNMYEQNYRNTINPEHYSKLSDAKRKEAYKAYARNRKDISSRRRKDLADKSRAIEDASNEITSIKDEAKRAGFTIKTRQRGVFTGALEELIKGYSTSIYTVTYEQKSKAGKSVVRDIFKNG